MDELGDCLLRNLDRVDRNLRRILWGRKTGIDGHEMGIFALLENLWLDASSRKGE